MKPGAQCVMTLGTVSMLEWSAGNLDSPDTVNNDDNHHDWKNNGCCNITDAIARTNAFYGQGSGPINIDDPRCTGSELRLIDCPFSPIHNCAHNEDAGVDCNLISTLISILSDRIKCHIAVHY